MEAYLFNAIMPLMAFSIQPMTDDDDAAWIRYGWYVCSKYV